MEIQTLQNRFTELYGVPPSFIVRAPGRVNLIGEHTDYNDGFVFPASIDYDITIVGAPRADRQVRVFSLTFDQPSTFSLDTNPLERSVDAPWSDYVRGVAHILQDEGFTLQGMNAVYFGTVPIGSGLSSSAAMEVASCLAFEATGGFDVEPVRRALIGQRVEREFVGVQSGIMDQFISALGRADHALFIDTRTLDYEPVPLPPHDVVLMVADTGKRRGLVDSEYNSRHAECEQAVEILKRSLPDIRALRDVDEETFAQYADALPEPVRSRARHVVTENARVLKGVRALKAGDVATFGRLMNASHDSLRDDYAVSSPELNAMVDAARDVEGVYGARMTGAGFGGCTVSLIAEPSVDAFKKEVGAAYRAATGLEATFYLCRASDGARRLA